MNAYNKHKEPSEEMKNIWRQKAILKEQILKFGKHDPEDLDYQTPERLQEILNNLKG